MTRTEAQNEARAAQARARAAADRASKMSVEVDGAAWQQAVRESEQANQEAAAAVEFAMNF